MQIASAWLETADQNKHEKINVGGVRCTVRSA